MIDSFFYIALLFIASGCASTPRSLQDSINDKIKERKGDISHCYEVRPEPLKTGTVEVSFSYDATGTVTSAEVKQSTLNDAVVESCVLTILKSIKFPPAPDKDTVRVSYPFRFVER